MARLGAVPPRLHGDAPPAEDGVGLPTPRPLVIEGAALAATLLGRLGVHADEADEGSSPPLDAVPALPRVGGCGQTVPPRPSVARGAGEDAP